MKTLLALILTLGIVNVFAMDYYDNQANLRFEGYLLIEKENILNATKDRLAVARENLTRAERDLALAKSVQELNDKVSKIKQIPAF